MTLLELNEIVSGKYKESVSKNFAKHEMTVEEFDEFRSMLSIDSKFVELLQATEDADEFFEVCELLGKVVPKEAREDLFYAAKLGYYFDGVPSKLTYILNKAVKNYDSPNVALSAIDTRCINKYLKEGALGQDITIKLVLESILGQSFELLTPYRRKVKYKNWHEVYVENTDRVVLVPDDIAGALESLDDLKNVNYNKELGVCVYDKPLRTINGRLGITLDDYDLRECV